jgi:hypothetical protein
LGRQGLSVTFLVILLLFSTYALLIWTSEAARCVLAAVPLAVWSVVSETRKAKRKLNANSRDSAEEAEANEGGLSSTSGYSISLLRVSSIFKPSVGRIFIVLFAFAFLFGFWFLFADSMGKPGSYLHTLFSIPHPLWLDSILFFLYAIPWMFAAGFSFPLSILPYDWQTIPVNVIMSVVLILFGILYAKILLWFGRLVCIHSFKGNRTEKLLIKYFDLAHPVRSEKDHL